MSGASAQPRPTGALWAPRTAHGAAPGPQRNAPDNPALPPLPAAPVAASGAPAESTPQRGGAPHSSGRSRTSAACAAFRVEGACAAFRVEGEPGGDVNAAGTAFEAGAPALSLSDDPYSSSASIPLQNAHQGVLRCADPQMPCEPPGPVLDPSQNSGTPGGSTTARDPQLTFQPPGIHR